MLPLVGVSGYVLLAFRRLNAQRMRRCRQLLRLIGVFPIRKHYYEPAFDITVNLTGRQRERRLPGLNFRHTEQVSFLQKLAFVGEFTEFVEDQRLGKGEANFKISNSSFGSGDAEYLYGFLRHVKPKTVVEVGCGQSTKIIRAALSANAAEEGHRAQHICIEPYQQLWLDGVKDIQLIRSTIEEVEETLFANLGEGDLLFIDSSHMVRPQGDVLVELLEIVPALAAGVFVHVHDIFSPRDYPSEWVVEKVLFWNEQYLLEALLSSSDKFEIIGAINYLKHTAYAELRIVCPFLTSEREPGSFYFRKIA